MRSRHTVVVSPVITNHMTPVGSFDSAVHISEEASNAATAVPWAIVGAIFVSGVLGWGKLSLPMKAFSLKLLIYLPR